MVAVMLVVLLHVHVLVGDRLLLPVLVGRGIKLVTPMMLQLVFAPLGASGQRVAGGEGFAGGGGTVEAVSAGWQLDVDASRQRVVAFNIGARTFARVRQTLVTDTDVAGWQAACISVGGRHVWYPKCVWLH
jgi:hypothetical protein